MASCEYCAMKFARSRCLCGVAYCDGVCQSKDYVRQHKGKCTKKDSGLGGMLMIFQVSEVFGTAYDSGQKLYSLT